MSPEQYISGEDATVHYGAKADVFAAGMCLFVLRMGRFPANYALHPRPADAKALYFAAGFPDRFIDSVGGDDSEYNRRLTSTWLTSSYDATEEYTLLKELTAKAEAERTSAAAALAAFPVLLRDYEYTPSEPPAGTFTTPPAHAVAAAGGAGAGGAGAGAGAGATAGAGASAAPATFSFREPRAGGGGSGGSSGGSGSGGEA